MRKVWLITGCSRGLGRSLAKAVLAAGDSLVATARSTRCLADLEAKHGDRVRTVALDVTDEASIYAALNAGLAAFGRIDVVVNNAGYGHIAAIEDVADDDFRAQFETNFFGLVSVTRAALPIFREQGAGHFIQVSSIGGRRGSPGLSAYQSAKFAVEGFSEVLHRETAALGLHVTIVEPGALRTDWAGASMHIGRISAPYESSVGATADYFIGIDGRQPGDPDRAAQAILQVARMPSPPLRLLLGSDAVRCAEQAAAAQAAEDRSWRSLSLSTDFPADVAEPVARRSLTSVCDEAA